MCLTIDDRTYMKVQIVRAAPLSGPDHYIAILDEQGDGICVIWDPNQLDVIKDGTESVRSFGPRLPLVDVDGNRFEIPNVNALDRRSARLLRSAL